MTRDHCDHVARYYARRAASLETDPFGRAAEAWNFYWHALRGRRVTASAQRAA